MKYIQSNQIEIRVAEGGKLYIKAFIPTEKLSHSIYHRKKRVFFKEKVSRGAFLKAIDKENLKLLLQHDYSKELESKDMEVYETERGLTLEATVKPNEELLEAISEEKINGVSYGFICGDDKFELINGEWIRTISSFEKIMEISILHSNCQPCYPLASAIVTDNREEMAIEEIQIMKEVIAKMRTDSIKEEVKQLKENINRLRKGRY